VITLRDYQVRLVSDVRAAWASTRAVLAVAPTGSGKTVLFAHIAHATAARGKRVWILAHRVELLDQISAALTAFDAPHGFIAAGYLDVPRAPIQVASVFTVAKRLKRVPPPDLIVVDEAHHATNGTTWGKVLAAFPRAYVLGVTATPCRLDGTGLRECFGAMVQGPTVADLTAQGYLVPLKAYAPASITTEGLHTRAGEYIASELETRVDNSTVTGDAVAHYRRLADGKRAVVFCVSVQHARHVAETFSAAGIPALSVDGTMDRTVRRSIVRGFTAGQIRVLTSCDLVSEGFDVPALECGISLRPTQSEGLWLQQVGRILRPAPGKPHAVLLDHAGNIARHGLPEDERSWSLDGLARAERSASDTPDVQMRVCPSCYAAVRGRPVACSECGGLFPVSPREVEVQAGELAEVTRETRRPRAATPATREQGQAREYDALVALGRKRGYSAPERWAAHIIEARAAKAARVSQTQGVG
jgi:DNA repair protein RadD